MLPIQRGIAKRIDKFDRSTKVRKTGNFGKIVEVGRLAFVTLVMFIDSWKRWRSVDERGVFSGWGSVFWDGSSLDVLPEA